MSAMRARSVLLLGVIGAAFAARGGGEGTAASPMPRSPQRTAKVSADGEGVSYERRSPFRHVINKRIAGPVEIGARWTLPRALGNRAEKVRSFAIGGRPGLNG
jgi:hypothetical protein